MAANPIRVNVTPHPNIMAGSQIEGFKNLSTRLLGTSKSEYEKKNIVKALFRISQGDFGETGKRVPRELLRGEEQVLLQMLKSGVANVGTIHEGH